MKLKINEKVTNVTELIHAYQELTTLHPNLAKRSFNFAIQEFVSNTRAMTEDNWILWREGIRLGLTRFKGYEGDKSAIHNIVKDRTHFAIEQNLHFVFPTETLEYLPLLNEPKDEYGDIRRYYWDEDDEHFVRVSNKNPNMVSLYINEKMLKLDRRSEMKFSKYLARFLKYEDNEEIKNHTSVYEDAVIPPRIQIAHSAEEIIRIYEKGPNSCMMGKEWSSASHPVQVYDHPLLCVAYITRPNDPNHITARTVIRLDGDTPKYIRTYGSAQKLSLALEKLGINKSETGLIGIEFKPIKHPNVNGHVVIPYLDGPSRAIEADPDNTLRVTPETTEYTQTADSTSGYMRHPNTLQCMDNRKLYYPEDCFKVHDITPNANNIISLDSIISKNTDNYLMEVERASGDVELWVKRTKHPHAIIDGKIYHYKDLDKFGIIMIDNAYIREDDERVARCPYSNTLGTKQNMLLYKGQYYNKLPPEFYFNPETTEFKDIKPTTDNRFISIKDIHDLLNATYGKPIYNTEIECEFPLMPATTAQVLCNTVNS